MSRVAIDIGIGGGTVFLERIVLLNVDITGVYRFENGPVDRDVRYVWDVGTLVTEFTTGIAAADAQVKRLDTVDIDTRGWTSNWCQTGNSSGNSLQ